MDIIDAFLSLKAEHKFTFVGLLLTTVVSLLTLISTLRISKKSAYINSITKERIDSLGELKEQAAQYLAVIFNYSTSLVKEEELLNYLKDLEYRQSRIIFQLNEKNEFESNIIEDLNMINKIVRILIHITEPKIVDIEQVLKENDFIKLALIDYLGDPNNNEKKKIEEILNELLIQNAKSLSSDLKKHLKNEWEKIKIEAK
ncbi:hypothetical protein RCG23_10760 [Neobacillus sp. PS3-34]|uniref:hypothetical protein n=1 Tax=Neobacillus sp. PS3-34 TaxID=3070678 RepID=UPI0027E08972|nr:hypothetical protein [Neobacillus sp. PS3-34]WML50237.1 hypothetical protein RCG23_10760 [Neobacillus sp. PS3-34]